jgi:hypothetical protein
MNSERCATSLCSYVRPTPALTRKFSSRRPLLNLFLPWLPRNHGWRAAAVPLSFSPLPAYVQSSRCLWLQIRISQVGIDDALVKQKFDTDEEIFEMNNGCICCTVRNDPGNLELQRAPAGSTVLASPSAPLQPTCLPIYLPLGIPPTFSSTQSVAGCKTRDSPLMFHAARHNHFRFQSPPGHRCWCP